ncbi:MAG: hypothetical protein KHY83_05750 [Coriobacteriia bacterium]|nr:hypothetical protein [Coriobacteriia bacterium]MBS5478152.1 hypothetical protein [Coriobacteriia bacterium]
MDSDIAGTLLDLGGSLAALAAKGTASAIATKVKSLKEEKSAEAVRNAYDELVNRLLEERSEAILIAQAYKAELDRVQISDEDIKSLDATIGRVLDVFLTYSVTQPHDSEKVEAQRVAINQVRQLISADTLRTMQLLGGPVRLSV